MNFELLHAQLLETVRQQIRNGYITERGLARRIGISQPHIHNVLKGVRFLTNHLADELILELKINVAGLAGDSRIASPEIRDIPLVEGLLGAESGDFDPCRTAERLPVPAGVTANLWRPVLAYLGWDEEAAPRFEAKDLVLIDQATVGLAGIRGESVYVVVMKAGPRLRYLRRAGGEMLAASEATRYSPERWEEALAGAVRGRVVWLSRGLPGG